MATIYKCDCCGRESNVPLGDLTIEEAIERSPGYSRDVCDECIRWLKNMISAKRPAAASE